MKPTKNRHYCIGCQRPKMLFETQEKAANFMRFNNPVMASNAQRIPARSYYCSFCCGWHITSIDDEEFAKSREKKDGLMWDSIRVAAKGKDLKIDNRLKIKERQSLPQKEKPKATDEAKEQDEMIDSISRNIQKVYVLLNQGDYETSRVLIEDSENIYAGVLELIGKHGLSVSRLQTTKVRLDKVTSWLNSLLSVRNNTVRQLELIKELEFVYTDKAYRIMLISLKNRERILDYVETVRKALEADNYEEAQKCCTEMEFVIRTGFRGGGAVANRKWARKQLASVKTMLNSKINDKTTKTMNLQDRFISIIDTIEKAVTLLGGGDAEKALELVAEVQSEVEDIEENYIALIRRSIVAVKEAAANATQQNNQESMDGTGFSETDCL